MSKINVKEPIDRVLREANRKFDAHIAELDPERAEQTRLAGDPFYVWGQVNGQLLNAFEQIAQSFAAGMRSVGR